jgi:hypothetical protein
MVPISPELQRSSPIACYARSTRGCPLGNTLLDSGLRHRGPIHDRGLALRAKRAELVAGLESTQILIAFR